MDHIQKFTSLVKVGLVKDLRNVIRFVATMHQTVNLCSKLAPLMSYSEDERSNPIQVFQVLI